MAAALDCEHLGMNYDELDPGEACSGGMHTHYDQGEVFYVIEGTATFETPDGVHQVGPHEAIRFAPGEFQTGRNESDRRVLALALGAPLPSEDTAMRGPCSECGETGLETVAHPEGGGLTGECPECGAEATVRPKAG